MALKDLHNRWKSTLYIQSLYYFQVVLTVFSPMNTVKQELFYASKEKASVVVSHEKKLYNLQRHLFKALSDCMCVYI